MPGYAKPPSYNANNISITPVGDLAATNLQDGLQELDGDLSVGLASKLPYSFGTATPSTTDSGFLWYDSNSTPAAPKFWDGAAFQALTSGKILQIVRATDSTARTTTSTAYVDVTGMSITITPTQSDSAVIIAAIFAGQASSTSVAFFRITDSSNNAISGAEEVKSGGGNNPETPYNIWAYATPATTSAVTYKLRFRGQGGAQAIANNNLATGQMYAIEVSA